MDEDQKREQENLRVIMKEIEKLRQDLKLKNETPPMPTLN